MRPSRVLLAIGLLVVAVTTQACESAEQKCAALRASTTQLWGKYADELQAELEATNATIAAAKKKLEGEIKQRHEAQAKQHADELHGTEVSTAWARTFNATVIGACANDAECLEMKVQVTEGDAKVKDLNGRIAAARAAQAAASGESEDAKKAADAVAEDKGHASYPPAHAASAEAATTCAGIKP